MDLAALSALSLPDQDGTPHRLGDLWSDKPVVLVFLRHFGCLHCREPRGASCATATTTSSAQGVDLVAIGTGDQRYAGAFVRDEKIPYLVLVDDDAQAAHAAVGERRVVVPPAAPEHLARRRSRPGPPRCTASTRRASASPSSARPSCSAPATQVRYSHVDADSTDHAPIPDVLAAVGV